MDKASEQLEVSLLKEALVERENRQYNALLADETS